jgi:hypothetical protein
MMRTGMRRVRTFAVRVRALFLRDRLDRDLAAEIDSLLRRAMSSNPSALLRERG